MKRTPLHRTKRLAPRNRKRAAAKFAKNYAPRGDVVRSMPCLVPGGSGETVAAHARARGMGGAKGDRRELIPLCQAHHTEAGEARTSQRAAFEERHRLYDLRVIAWRIAEQLDEAGLP